LYRHGARKVVIGPRGNGCAKEPGKRKEEDMNAHIRPYRRHHFIFSSGKSNIDNEGILTGK
jgi:hypothetical protein